MERPAPNNKQTIGGNTLTETFTYDNLNRLKTAQATGQSVKNFSYNIIDNITSKDGVGAYDYTPAPGSLLPNERPHPHAVRKVNGGPNIAYDMNGNMTSGLGRTITWTWFNMPERIQMNPGATSDFTYDPDHNRITQRCVGLNGLVTTAYVGGFYEKVSEGNYDYRKHYINSPTGRVAVFTEKVQAISFGQDPPVGTIISTDTKYFHKDHLGSIDTITNEVGAVIERDSFDAWGSHMRATNS
jgi:uncharacterized protein RhaS with RHS repeats